MRTATFTRWISVPKTFAWLAQPAVQRPILRLQLIHARFHSGSAVVFVSDCLATIGNEETERVAVVGALLEQGCEVVIDGQDIDAAWYQSRASRLDFKDIDTIRAGLLDEMSTVALVEQLPNPHTDGFHAVFPTSISLTPEVGRLRIRELAELEGMTVSRIVRRLRAEGHQNAHWRRTWYPAPVREALDAGL